MLLSLLSNLLNKYRKKQTKNSNKHINIHTGSMKIDTKMKLKRFINKFIATNIENKFYKLAFLFVNFNKFLFFFFLIPVFNIQQLLFSNFLLKKS